MITKGQIWEWNVLFGGILPLFARKKIKSKKDIFDMTGPLTAVEIVSIFESYLGGFYHGAVVLRDDSNYFDGALTDAKGHLILMADGFNESVQSNELVLLFDAPRIGVKCTKCNKDFPDTDYIEDFKCWGCRNGV